MADYSIVTSDVALVTGRTENGYAGESVEAGFVGYKDIADGDKWKLAESDEQAANAGSNGIGIFLNNAFAGQPVVVCIEGDITTSTEFTECDILILSSSRGKMCPPADMANGWYGTVLGIAIAANRIKFKPIVSGKQKTAHTPSNTPSATPSHTTSSTPSSTQSASATVSSTPSATPSSTPSSTVSNTPSTSVSNTPSGTPSNTVSSTPSTSPSATPSATPSPSNTQSNTSSNTPSATPSRTSSSTPSASPSGTPTL